MYQYTLLKLAQAQLPLPEDVSIAVYNHINRKYVELTSLQAVATLSNSNQPRPNPASSNPSNAKKFSQSTSAGQNSSSSGLNRSSSIMSTLSSGSYPVLTPNEPVQPPQQLSAQEEFSMNSFPSDFYSNSCKYFTQPTLYNAEEDQTTPDNLQKEWRTHKQAKYLERVQRQLHRGGQSQNNTTLSSSTSSLASSTNSERPRIVKFDTQIALMNDVKTEMVTMIQLHPVEPYCIAADDTHKISVWNWKDSSKLKMFHNQNLNKTRITCMRLANTHQEEFLLIVGSSDGIVRIWKNIESPIPQLVSAWKTVSDIQPAPSFSSSSGLILDWNQEDGQLVIFIISLSLHESRVLIGQIRS